MRKPGNGTGPGQDVFLQAYFSIGTLQRTCQLKTWLLQIAKNSFYMQQRKEKLTNISLEDLAREPPRAGTFFCRISEEERLIHARKVIDTMQPKMRDIMLYWIYSDLPYLQIARLLFMSESSAKVLFYREKHILHNQLQEKYGYEL